MKFKEMLMDFIDLRRLEIANGRDDAVWERLCNKYHYPVTRRRVDQVLDMMELSLVYDDLELRRKHESDHDQCD